MTSKTAPGCLGSFLKLLGIRPTELATRGEIPTKPAPQGEVELPYRLRDDFLSQAEFSFYRVLVQAVEDAYVVMAKVRISDLLFVPRQQRSRGSQNRIDRKHIDFLLCDSATLAPVLAIELDDSSHQRAERQRRDDFVDKAFDVAGLPLMRVPARRAYSVEALKHQIQANLQTGRITSTDKNAGGRKRPAESRSERDPSSVPDCPKCDTPMVQRKASKGKQAGSVFWGCPNFPHCRESRAM